ncbi:putative late blight resistance protein homolog R1B-23 isoform X1 [Coffea eugenioides]|uniref:putative late blight resistance protein homolog R1B-23 isoform X1 n=1 Tax=Coffea eugenioides TaxID=49369 RepID=UPI000F6050ED|nr:putative late blight resistance protein homolog R1B-23 isoform X1 [Coffea eugenioides]
MSKTFNSVDYILKVLEGTWGNDGDDAAEEEDAFCDPFENLKVELRLLRTFLKYVGNWRDTDDTIQADFLVLDAEFEAALSVVKRDLSTASYQKGYERSAEFLDSAIAQLQEKITFFRRKVMKIYEYMTNYSFQSEPPPLTKTRQWNEFFDSLEQNLKDLLHGNYKLIEPVLVRELMALEENVIPFKELAWWSIRGADFVESDVLVQFAELGLQAAHLSYSCWCDKMDDEKISLFTDRVVMLSDLQKKLKLNTPQVADIYLNVLRGIKSYPDWAKAEVVDYFVDFLVPKKDQQLEIINQGFVEFILFLLDSCDALFNKDEVQLLLRDVVVVAIQIGSIGCSMTENMDEKNEVALYKLHSKMELLKAEAFLSVVLKPEDATVCYEERIDAHREGLKLLRKLLTDSPQGKTESNKTIWIHISALAKEVRFAVSSLKGKLFARRHRDVLEVLKVFLTEAFFTELLNSQPYSDLMINDRENIETIYEGLILIRTFLMGPGEKNEELLSGVVSVSKFVRSLYDSFLASNFREDLVGNINLLLPKLVKRIKPFKEEIKNIYLQQRSSMDYNFPRTNGVGFMDFLLGNLGVLYRKKDLGKRFIDKFDSNACMKRYVEALSRQVKIMRSLLKNIIEQYNEHSDLNDLRSCIIDMAYETEYFIDKILVGGCVEWYHALWFSDLIEEFKVIKLQASAIFDKMYSIEVHNVVHTSGSLISPAIVPNVDEVVIDLDDQAELIMDRLTRGTLQQQVVSIVGMPGLGKTTLAKKVYNDPSITYHFHIRAWCYISQVYRKRELLLNILSDIMELTNDVLELSEDDLEFKLYQCLKNRKYLIVLDDLWSREAWNDLEFSLPDDKNGSRILITSRLTDVALTTKSDSIAHSLRLFSDDESWNLLQKKLFNRKDCPDELVNLGKKIARGCKGLPLAVVAISGLLQRTGKKQDWWETVARTLSSCIADDPETRCMDILELSYSHLPTYLKPCFLYLGAFLKDREIPVSKLTRLWIAEGFVQNPELDSLEHLAEKYLNDLIGRSLVIASKRKSNGGVKTCRVHDMLRALCLVRCKEQNFLHSITGVLDLECINMGHCFPRGLEHLVHLRYLAVCGDLDSIPASISCLWNLETLLVRGLKGKVDLPHTFWSMVKLRRVHVKSFTSFSFVKEDSSQLDNLVTLSSPVLFSGEETEKLMRQLPQLQKLGCIFSESKVDTGKGYGFPLLGFLTQLEALKVTYSGRFCHPRKFDFPLNLKKLTLSKFCLPWDCVSEIGRLPNLEVLKLLSRAFEGERWNMKEGEFLELKFLKLDTLNIAQWNASADHLPKLQQLVLRNCRHLEEVPSGFADIPTLVMIEMQLCRSSAEESVRILKEEQLGLGIDDLKVLINC